MIIPPPPGTDQALQGIDPRRLHASFKRGMGALAMQGNFDDETTSQGARLVSIAAITRLRARTCGDRTRLSEIADHSHYGIAP